MAKFNKEKYIAEFEKDVLRACKQDNYLGCRIVNLGRLARAVCRRLNYTPLYVNQYLVVEAVEKWWLNLPDTNKWEKNTGVRRFKGRAFGLSHAMSAGPYAILGGFELMTDYGPDE